MNPPSDVIDYSLRYHSRWLAGGIMLLVLVLVLSLWSISLDVPQAWGADKILHFVTFAVLMLWFSGIYPMQRAPQLFIRLLLFGALIEVLQAFTGYRLAQWLDLAADAVGLGIGWWLATRGLAGWCRRAEARMNTDAGA